MLNRPELFQLNVRERENNSFLGQNYMLIRPGGNDTCLVSGIIENTKRRKKINDFIMNLYPNVEQVGFVNLNKKSPELMMAGGEFCGNATRSTAWLALDGKPGVIKVKVLGVDKPLKAGVSEDGEAFAQMPIYEGLEKVNEDPKNEGNYIVEMQGITQYIDFNVVKLNGLSADEIKEKAFETIKEKGLDQYSAAGVIYAQKEEGQWRIIPVIYVRDINTLFLETACGSGTTALGQVLALKKGESIKDVEVIQPSGLPIKVSVDYSDGRFGYAQIKGPIKKLKSGTLESACGFDYVLENIDNRELFNDVLTRKGLAKLYQEIFSKPPYEELFTEDDVKSIFDEYLQYGQILVAKNMDGIIGFEAAVPLRRMSEARWITAGWNINIDNAWYIADLGVENKYRRKSMGKRLIERQLELLPKNTNILVRTSESNAPARTLYETMNFKQMDGVFQTVESMRVDGIVKGDKRVFYMTKT